MKKKVDINARDQRMLELLAEGASSKLMAKKMGYREGTMRVYLHDLYRKIGVPNKTNAVIWYFDRNKAKESVAAVAARSASMPSADQSFGDFALRENLHAALGAMNMFLGPYGRLWDVSRRLKGSDAPDAELDGRRRQSRALWEALLRADFAYAKGLHDQGTIEAICADSPTDAVLAVVLLLIGGYTRAAEKVVARLSRRRRIGPSLSESERTLMKSLRDAMDGGSDEALACLHRLAGAKPASSLLPQAAMAAMFHVYSARKDADRARETANALCALAEGTRQHLHAMGERPLYRQAELPRPPATKAKSVAAYRKRIAGARAATVDS